MKNISRLFRVVVFISLVMALDVPISYATKQPGCPDYQPPADQGTPPGDSSTSTTSTATGQVQSTIPQVEGAIAAAMGEDLGAIDAGDLSGVFDSIDMDNSVAIYTEFETSSGVDMAPGSTTGNQDFGDIEIGAYTTPSVPASMSSPATVYVAADCLTNVSITLTSLGIEGSTQGPVQSPPGINVGPTTGGDSSTTDFSYGTTVTLTATPYPYIGWSGDSSGIWDGVSVTMSSDKTVVGGFCEVPTVAVESPVVSPPGINAGSTTTGDSSTTDFSYGATVTLTATPASGYAFTSWGYDVGGDRIDLSVQALGITDAFRVPPHEVALRWSWVGVFLQESPNNKEHYNPYAENEAEYRTKAEEARKEAEEYWKKAKEDGKKVITAEPGSFDMIWYKTGQSLAIRNGQEADRKAEEYERRAEVERRRKEAYDQGFGRPEDFIY